MRFHDSDAQRRQTFAARSGHIAPSNCTDPVTSVMAISDTARLVIAFDTRRATARWISPRCNALAIDSGIRHHLAVPNAEAPAIKCPAAPRGHTRNVWHGNCNKVHARHPGDAGWSTRIARDLGPYLSKPMRRICGNSSAKISVSHITSMNRLIICQQWPVAIRVMWNRLNGRQKSPTRGRI